MRKILLLALFLVPLSVRAATVNVYQLFQNVKAVQSGPSANATNTAPNGLYQTWDGSVNGSALKTQAFLVTVSAPGTASCTVQVVGSNDGASYVTYGATLTATNGAPAAGSGTVPFAYLGGYVTAISGTGAQCGLNVSG